MFSNQKIGELIFLLALFFLPIYQTINHWFFGILIFFTLIIFFKNKIKFNSFFAKSYLIISGLCLINIIGLFTATNINDGINDLTKSLPFLIYPIAIYILFYNSNRKLLELKSFYAIALGCIVSAIILWLNIFINVVDNDIAATTFFGWKTSGIHLTKLFDIHPPYLGLFVVLSILFLGKEFFYKSYNLKIKTLLLLSSILLFLFLINITARNALFYLITIGFIIGIYSGNRKIVITQAIVVIGIISLIAFHPSQYYKYKLYRMIGIAQTNNIEDKRFKRLESSYIVFKDNPIFGAGPGDDETLKIKQYVLMKDNIAVKKKLNSHNQLFEYLAKYGIIGAIIFCLNVIYFSLFFLKRRQYLYFLFILLLFSASLTESIFERVLGIQYFCVVITIGICSILTKRENSYVKN